MSAFQSLAELNVIPIWGGVIARAVEGREMTLAVVELGPDTVVSPHQHPNEQIGIVVRGSLRFTVGPETRVLHAGETYCIHGGVLHDAVAGPDGCVAIDIFAPVREDWRKFTPEPPRPPDWP
jgi:quercetin dioxygenase-like cupin family protein